MASSSNLPIACNDHRVTVIGAGHVGSTLAHRIAQRNLANVVLLDIVPGIPQGIALDLMEAQGMDCHNREIIGTNDYMDTTGSDVVIITAGLPRKPGMNRDDLLKINAKIAVEVAEKAIARSPDALYIIVTNPLDVMTYLVWQILGLPASRVMGMAGMLDSARFQTFIAMELGVSIADVSGLVLGGHGDLMVPLPRYSTVRGIPITELMDEETVDRLVDRTRHGGAEIVNLMKTGGAYSAPASSTCAMVEAILHNQSRLLPVSSYLDGEYGLKDIFIGVPTRLGCRGVEKVVEINLTDTELTALHTSAESVRKNIKRAQEMLG